MMEDFLRFECQKSGLNCQLFWGNGIDKIGFEGGEICGELRGEFDIKTVCLFCLNVFK